MKTKSIKNKNEKATYKDPAFPDDPTKVIEVDVYELETVNTIKITKTQLEEKKAHLEAELLEINKFLNQINS